jgi:hypothetical protein
LVPEGTDVLVRTLRRGEGKEGQQKTTADVEESEGQNNKQRRRK